MILAGLGFLAGVPIGALGALAALWTAYVHVMRKGLGT